MSALAFRTFFAVLIVLILSILPLPEFIAPFRPSWTLMLVLYIQFFMPDYFRISWIFLLGLSLDVLLASPLGLHAFALVLTSFLAFNKSRRFVFFSVIQQVMLVVFFCFIYQTILMLMDASLGNNNGILFVTGTVFATMIFWPWIKLLADNTLRVGVH